MSEKSAYQFCALLACFLLSGCVTSPGPEPAALQPPVGIIRFVTLSERYVIFESEFRMPAGRSMRLLREGVPIGMLQAGSYRRRKFQSADILEGRPRPGDLAEPVLPVQSQAAQ